MSKIYFYPPNRYGKRKVKLNPYTDNFVNGLTSYCNVLNYGSRTHIPLFDVFLYLFKIDTIIFNWIENIGHRRCGILQFLILRLLWILLKYKNIKIIWIMHNIHPHQKENWISKSIKNMMFEDAYVIVTHSKEAKIYASKYSNCKILFFHHPNNLIKANNRCLNDNFTISNAKFDILIWGSIEPYKGIVEFLDFMNSEQLNWKVKIIGKCTNYEYLSQITIRLTDCIDFENRTALFDELYELILSSKYVLFPYLSSSVSGSGALMDTLSLGGNVIGPNQGAFADMAEEKLCFIYDSYHDIKRIVSTQEQVHLERIQEFTNKNTWDHFCLSLINEI